MKIPTDITEIRIPGNKYMQALEIANNIRKTGGFVLHINNILRIKNLMMSKYTITYRYNYSEVK